MKVQEYSNVYGRELTVEPREPRVGVWRRATPAALEHMRRHFGAAEASEAEFEFAHNAATRISDGQTFRYAADETPWLTPTSAMVDAWVVRDDGSLVVMEDGRDRSVRGQFLYDAPVARQLSAAEVAELSRPTDRDWLLRK